MIFDIGYGNLKVFFCEDPAGPGLLQGYLSKAFIGIAAVEELETNHPSFSDLSVISF